MKKKYYILAAALLLAAVAVGLALPEAAVRTGDARLSAKVQYAEGEALSMEGMEPLTLAEKMHIAGKSDRLYRMAVTEGTALHRDEALEIARRVCAAFQEAKLRSRRKPQSRPLWKPIRTGTACFCGAWI